MLYRILKFIARVLFRLWFRLEVRGTEHVPASAALMIVANHSCALDPPLIGAMAPRTLFYMAKAELFSIPLFGRLLRAVNARPVRRDGTDAGALRQALRILEGGRALLVFPEGTRGPEGVLRDGKPGAGMLALLTGAAVVPAYVEGTGRLFPRGRTLPRPGKIRIRFGPAFAFGRVEGRERKGQYAEASREMMAAIARLKDAAAEGAAQAAASR